MTALRPRILGGLYKHIAKPIFFRQDPELVHDRMTRLGQGLGSNLLTQTLTRTTLSYKHPMLEQDIAGIHFANPIGLAAGFDKNAQLTQILPSVGFGFEEIGSVTGEPCDGNPKPRLWRHPETKSLRVYYGLKNDGAEAIAKRLSKKSLSIPIGTSVAKTNCREVVDLETGIKDYVKAYKAFRNIGAYTTINISCPNTFGGEPFTDPKKLRALLGAIDDVRDAKPIFIKFSPNSSLKEIDALVAVASEHNITGFISTNLLKNHGLGPGGMSGKMVQKESDQQLRHLATTYGGQFIYIGCGGVSSAKDAYAKIRSGASLIQLIAGMIYEGPQLIGQINRDLVGLLKRDGYSSITKAIGADLK